MEMKKKNTTEFEVEKYLTAILAEGQKREIILEGIKSNKGSFEGMYDYLVEKFHNEQVVNMLNSEILIAEVWEYIYLLSIKELVKEEAIKLDFKNQHLVNLMKMKPMEALMYLQGYMRAKKIKVRRNYLSLEDEATKNYFRLIEEVLAGKTKYRAIKDYLKTNPNIKTTERTYSNSFDSFLDTHSDIIKIQFKLAHPDFMKKFFPRKKVK